VEPDDAAIDDDLDDDEAAAEDDLPDDDLTDTGLDLSEASDLDADNVLADEESARVVQAPD
jgi:hypothetical protein